MNCYRFNSQHNWMVGHLYDHSTSSSIFFHFWFWLKQSYEVYEESECGHNSNLSIISHQLQRVSYRTRSGCVIMTLHSRHGYLKVHNPNQWLFLVGTDVWMFEWYLGWCGSKNGNCKDLCVNEIGLCARNMIIILGSIIKITGRNFMTIWRAWESFNWQWLRYSYELWKPWSEWLQLGLDLLTISYESCVTYP
jgi:hypothetical protein